MSLRHHYPGDHSTPFVFLVWVVVFSALSCALATFISWIIFGLQREVASARQLGQYVLEQRIGAGGMGVVYRARHALLRRPTAVKLLPPERAASSAMLATVALRMKFPLVLTRFEMSVSSPMANK